MKTLDYLDWKKLLAGGTALSMVILAFKVKPEDAGEVFKNLSNTYSIAVNNLPLPR